MPEHEWAWAAGLFEGEGTIGRYRGYWRLSISMSDLDVMQHFKDVVVVGNLSEFQSKIAGRKRMYNWYMSQRKEVARILEHMIPYFGARRGEVATECIVELATTSPQKRGPKPKRI